MNACPRRTTLALAAILALPAALRAQDIGDKISVLAQENAQGYVHPLAQGLGAALTAGLVTDATPHHRFGFSIGVRGAGAFFPDKAKTFSPVLPASVTVNVPNYGSRTYSNPYTADGGTSPTVAGKGPGVVLSPTGQFRQDLIAAGQNPDDYRVDFPEGADLPVAPFAVIDADLGLGFGTDVIVRLIPTLNVNEDVGDLSAFGVGVMHSISQYLSVPTPVDISVTAGYQRVKLGDYAESRGTTFGAIAGVGAGPLHVFAKGNIYSATTDVDYTYQQTGQPDVHIGFSDKVSSTGRFGLGLSLDLLVLKLSAEYDMGDYNVASARVGFGIG